MERFIDDKPVFVATGNKDLSPERETVVFIHGAGQNHTIWVLPTRYFARKEVNVLSVDLPGHGKSVGPCLTSIEEMADWIVGLMQAVNIQRAAMVGHSMGSLVALATAARYPDRTRCLAMVGTSVPMPVSDALLSTSEASDHLAVDMLTYWGHSASAHLGGNPTPGMWTLGCAMRLLEQADEGVLNADLRACNEYHAGLEHAAAVKCPTMLILGQHDMMTPVRATRELTGALRSAETVIFPGSGHALLAERPDPVLDALIRIV